MADEKIESKDTKCSFGRVTGGRCGLDATRYIRGSDKPNACDSHADAYYGAYSGDSLKSSEKK